jgi:putative transposase
MILSHRIQLIPRNKHVAAFNNACGCARFTWNWALARWKELYEAGEKPTALGLKKEWNVCKPEWVYESPKDCNQQPFSNLGKAFDRFFKKKARYPKFKKKGQHDSFYVSNDKFKVDGAYVRLPKIGRVKMTEGLRLKGKIMSATISREVDRWFIAFSVDVGEVEKSRGTAVVGVDLGVKTSVTLSDGTRFEGPKPLKNKLKRLKKRQRKHSRKEKGSRNRAKSALRLARLHRKVKNSRKDFLHKVTSMLVSKAKTLVIEDLNVKGMLSNRRLARAISDIGFGEFRRQLEYKCSMRGVELLVADRFYPSSKLCNRCGVKQDMPLSTRTYRCSCGYVEDRDVNAALNLRTLGLRETNACGHGSSGRRLGVDGETDVVEAGTRSLANSTVCHI